MIARRQQESLSAELMASIKDIIQKQSPPVEPMLVHNVLQALSTTISEALRNKRQIEVHRQWFGEKKEAKDASSK